MGHDTRVRQAFRALMALVLLVPLFTYVTGGRAAAAGDSIEIDGNATTETSQDWDKVNDGSLAGSAEFHFYTDDGYAFTGGGTKTIRPISEWRWDQTENVPDVNDLLNGFGAAFVEAGDLVFYFGADRFAVNGDSGFGFWFLKNPLELQPDGTFSGAHTTGDVMVRTEFVNGGGTAVLRVFQWTGDDATGTLTEISPNGSISVVNAADEPSPWPYIPKAGDPKVFPPGALQEGRINLSDVLGSNVCFASAIGVTETSQETTSQMKDFILAPFGDFQFCSGDVEKTADPTSLAEPGGPVEFTVTVNNTSAVSDLTIDSLTDDIYGDLTSTAGDIESTTCSLPQTIPAGDSYTCSFTADVLGNAGDAETDTVTASGAYEDGTPFSDADSATVTITDIPPTVTLTKNADPLSLDEPGGTSEFTLGITNTAWEPVRITSLTDDYQLSAECDDLVGTWLDPGETATCTYTVDFTTAGTYDNTARVDVVDDDGSTAYDEASASVTVNDLLPVITVDKTATPGNLDEPGGTVTFTVTVHNGSNTADPVVLTSLMDSIYGNLNGQGTCATGGTIQPGDDYVCQFSATVSGDAGDTETDIVTAKAVDDEGNEATDADDAVVVIDDAKPVIEVTKTADPTSVAEPGGDVTFTVTVKNQSVEDVEITSLTDSDFDLSPECDSAVGTVLAPGATYTCTFTEFVAGDASDPDHENTVTAIAVDNEQNEATDSDSATVEFTDVLPTIEVTKTATPTSVAEPGGDVTFTVTVRNQSVEDVEITSLTDTDFDLSAQCSDAVGTVLVPGATYTCTFTEALVGDASGIGHENTVTAIAVDDEGNEATDSDSATVEFTDVLPAIEVTKTADPTSVGEPGGSVTYTFTVANLSTVEMVTIDSLDDSIYGDLTLVPGSTCSLPQTLAPAGIAGDTYECSITVDVVGDAGDVIHNVVTASGTDNEGNRATATDNADVTIADVKPVIEVTKTADPTSVAEPGGNVEFTVTVENQSVEDVEITSLTDSDFDLSAQCSDAVGTVLAPGATYTCTFTEFVTGDASGADHENTVTAIAADDEGNEATDSATATVEFTDVPPTATLEKTATPTLLAEPGGDVTYDVVITNTSVEALTLDDLVDDVFGDLNGQGTCAAGGTIAAGGTYTCSFAEAFSGTAGDSLTDTITATLSDNEGNEVKPSDDATVTITDVGFSVGITKTADPTSIDEPGGTVTFTVVVTNTSSVEPLTILSLVDDTFGDLNGQGDCVLPATLPAATEGSTTYTCTFTAEVTGNAGYVHTNVVTASITDGDSEPVDVSDDATVTITDVASSITVTKTPSVGQVAEPGDVVAFTVEVTNTSAVDTVTITSLVDDTYGNLHGEGDCAVPFDLAPGEGYTCTFNGAVTGSAGDTHTNTVTADGQDDDGNPVSDDDTATVAITDVPSSITVDKTPDPSSVPEPGASVTYTVVVTNTSDVDTVTITHLVDSVFGDLGTACELGDGIVLKPGESFTCTFDGQVSGNAGDAHVNVVTASGYDDDDNDVEASDDATVAITDVTSAITVTKSADPSSVQEPGGTVTFTVTVTNTSAVDTVTITSLVDDVYGDLNGQGDCAVPFDLAPGEDFSCSFDGAVSGDGGDTHTNTVTATGVDDDENVVTGEDSADVAITETPVTDLEITKTGPASSIDEGGDAAFTITVTNNGPLDEPDAVVTDTLPEGLVFTSATPSQGTCTEAAGVITCDLGALASGASATIIVVVNGPTQGTYVNVAVVSGEVVDSNPDNNEAQDDVTVVQVLATTSTAPPETLPFTGADSGGMGGTGIALVLLGGLLLLAVRKREDVTTEVAERLSRYRII